MEDVTIPGWALLASGVIFVPWLIWLTHRSINSERDSAVRGSMLDSIPGEMEKIYKQIKDGDEKIDNRFKELNTRFDMFIHQEMTLLKQIVQDR
jgi:hypothetical protein